MQAISYKRIWIWIWIGYISKLSFGYRIWIYILFKIEDMDMILYPKKMDMTHSCFTAFWPIMPTAVVQKRHIGPHLLG